MRIIAGERRGHKIEGPVRREIRPTSDMVREAIFNILGTRIEEANVVDMFAGTGALGLEALSRGATRAVFVERDRENASLIRRNLATLRYEDRAVVLVHDAYRWARSLKGMPEGPAVVFIDPPYRDAERRPERLDSLLTSLQRQLQEGSTIVFETGEFVSPELQETLGEWDQRRYGGTLVAISPLVHNEDAIESGPLAQGDDHGTSVDPSK